MKAGQPSNISKRIRVTSIGVLVLLCLAVLWIAKSRKRDFSTLFLGEPTAPAQADPPLKNQEPANSEPRPNSKERRVPFLGEAERVFVRRPERLPRVHAEMDGIIGGIFSYHEEFGEYPSGDNLAVAKALLGSNEKRKVFLGWNKKSYSVSGELLDPWNTPYQIFIDSSGTIAIRSAGPDLLFSTSDDWIWPKATK